MSEQKPDPTNPGSNSEEHTTLEDRLRRLEEIVGALESGELELEGALGLFEEGVAHLKASEALLSQAELKVEELLGEVGEPEVRPFEGGDGS